MDFNLAKRGGHQPSYFQKNEHPLLDAAKMCGKNSHEASSNFRLTGLALLHLTGVRNHWSLPIPTIAAICSILITSCFIAYRITGDRVCACFIALNEAATYVGSFGFIW